MSIRKWLAWFGVCSILTMSAAVATEQTEQVEQAESTTPSSPPSDTLSSALAAALQKQAESRAKLAANLPAAVSDALARTFQADALGKMKVNPAPLKGMYEVVLGSDVFYISEDGKYLLVGDLRDTNTGENLTDVTRNELRKTVLATMPEDKMIVFPAKGETLYTVSVFTDVDCPYCSKLHDEVPKLNEAGVTVRYLAYPRAGQGSKTYKTMVSVWCADDPLQAMTDAKARKPVEAKQCENPVQEQFLLGQEVGVTGTPALVLSDGELVPGYVQAERLVAYLEGKASSKATD